MIQFAEAHLPESFVLLLKEQELAHKNPKMSIASLLNDFESIKLLALNSMEEFYQGQLKIEEIVKSLGWNKFRDRLSSVYVEKYVTGYFPCKTNLELVKDILDLEESLLRYSVSDTARGFLISFYFKLQSIHTESENNLISNLPYYKSIQDSLELMKHLKMKVLDIDWLLIQLIHFCEFLSVNKVEEILSKGSYDDLYQKLTSSQKRSYALNLLHYGYAINDIESLAPAAHAI